MKPRIIGISGGSSGSGKTTAACQILGRLRGWGAIKYTRASGEASVVDDPGVLRTAGKDTAKMLEAGAEAVLWVRSPREKLPGALKEAVARLSHLSGIVVEGNSAVELLDPEVVVFVAGGGGIKPGAERLLERASVVLHGGIPPAGAPARARALRTGDPRLADLVLALLDSHK
ncbi:MAG: hypothetical protein Kow0025_02460 [Thermodesulfovibrionales bacterium]